MRKGENAQPYASWIDRAQRFKLCAFACKISISSSSEHRSATLVCLLSRQNHASDEKGCRFFYPVFSQCLRSCVI